MKLAIVTLLLFVGCSSHKPRKVSRIENSAACPSKLTGECFRYDDNKIRCTNLRIEYHCTGVK